MACAQAGRRRASPSRRSLIRAVQGTSANARANERDLTGRTRERLIAGLHGRAGREAAGIGARMKVEMERLLDRVGRVRPVILYPFALILGFLLAYAWWLVIVGVILPVFVQLVGAD